MAQKPNQKKVRKPTRRQQPSNYMAADPPLAVPLDVAAQLLAKPLHELERADVNPYQHADGSPRYSLRELAKALGLVEPRETREARRRGRAPERAAS
jgi:hypothetical protein